MKTLLVIVSVGFAACVAPSTEIEPIDDAAETAEIEARRTCPSGPGVIYYATKKRVCQNILFSCDTGWTPFNNECGCGCIPPPCERTGCFGELCSDTPLNSICIWDDTYACFDDTSIATCERQPEGWCGWNYTPELNACLAATP